MRNLSPRMNCREKKVLQKEKKHFFYLSQRSTRFFFSKPLFLSLPVSAPHLQNKKTGPQGQGRWRGCGRVVQGPQGRQEGRKARRGQVDLVSRVGERIRERVSEREWWKPHFFLPDYTKKTLLKNANFFQKIFVGALQIYHPPSLWARWVAHEGREGLYRGPSDLCVAPSSFSLLYIARSLSSPVCYKKSCV